MNAEAKTPENGWSDVVHTASEVGRQRTNYYTANRVEPTGPNGQNTS